MSRQLETLRAFVGARPTGAWRPVTQAVVVGGGKGGVGVSTVSTLVAMGGAQLGRDTLLVNASPSGSSISSLLGLPVMAGDDANAGLPAYRTLSPHLTLVSVEAGGQLSTGERRAALRRIATRYDDYAFVVVDAGATCEAVGAAVPAGAGIFLAVGSHDRLSTVATYALVKYVSEKFTALPVAVLFNRCDPAEGSAAFAAVAAGVEEFLSRTVTPAGVIPEDGALRSATETGQSPATTDGPARLAARLLAELLLGRPARRSFAPLHVT